MKTHNYGPSLAILAAACSLAACGEPSQGPSAATEAPAPSSAGDPAPAARSVVTPGLYHVCRVDADAQLHHSQVGDHVPDGSPVFIKPIDPKTGMTLVCLGETCPDDPTLASVQDVVFWMAGDETRLSTVKEFVHKKKDTMEAIPLVRHLVQLSKEAEDQKPTDKCTKDNVLVLHFCEWGEGEDGPTWLCEGSHPHAGAVHLEP